MNLLRRFGNSSIRTRLLLFGGFSGALIAGIYLAIYWTDVRVEQAYGSVDAAQQTIQAAYGSIEDAGKLKDEISLLTQDVMELRLREKTYLQFHRAELTDRFEQLAVQMSRDRATIMQRCQIAGEFEKYRTAFAQRVALQTQHDSLKQTMTEPLRASETRLGAIQSHLEARQSQLQMEGATLRPDEAEMLNVARDCTIVFLRLQNLQQQFLVTGDARYTDQYKKVANEDAKAGIRALREFATALGNTNFVESARLISASLDLFLKDMDKSLTLTAQQKQLEELLDAGGAAMLQTASQHVAGANRQVLDQKQNVTIANDQMRQARGAATGVKKTANRVILAIVLTTMLMGTLVCALTIASVNGSLNTMIGELDVAATQTSQAAAHVSSASQSLAEGASQQAASVEETSASLEEMASMTQHNAETAHKVNTLAKEARGVADTGARDMQEMSSAMDEIKASSDDIAKIIKTIDEIAFQTNILALNAAVEAARAGEAGMGFAVVADEVRTLAQRSAQAARETAAKIEGAITKSTKGVAISGKVAAALNDIVTKVREVDELVAAVANASREQSQGITQINAAVGQMDQVTQSNAANAEESASAAEELSAQAEILRSAVKGLEQLVGGAGSKLPTGKRTTPGRPLVRAAALPPMASGRDGNGHCPPRSPGQKCSSRATAAQPIPMEDGFKEF